MTTTGANEQLLGFIDDMHREFGAMTLELVVAGAKGCLAIPAHPDYVPPDRRPKLLQTSAKNSRSKPQRISR